MTAQRRRKVLAVIERVSTGSSVLKACVAERLDKGHFYEAIDADRELATKYARACEERATTLAEQALEISDEADGGSQSQVAKAKLQADTRKWFAARMAPRKWGDRVALAGDAESPLKVQALVDLVRSADDD